MILKRLLLGLAALAFAATPLFAATVEDRSPFRQGHWWDPTRPGHGFEILNNAGGDVFVVWYTYDTAGQPIWYTAQGTRSSMGTIWPLQKHRWGDGRIVESANVGILRLSVDHFEKMTASWQLDGGQGTWTLEPFVQSGTINEVDLSGHWYDPANVGWGMTLVDQGDVFGAVIYAYDTSGSPTWVAGFDRGKGTRIDLHSVRGPCPSCASRPVGSNPVGSIDIAYQGDTEITIRGAPTIALAPGLRIDGAQARQLGRPASARRADYQLASFARDQTLKDFLEIGMAFRTFSVAGSDFSPAPPGAGATPVSFSTTNVQEEGVDEADLVKSDGRYVYALTPTLYTYTPGPNGTPGTSTARRDVRIAWVGGGAGVESVGQFPLYAGQGYMAEAGLYIHANTLVTLATGYFFGGWYYSPLSTADTSIELLDLSNPAVPGTRWRVRLSGTMVSSRRIGDRLYVVTRFAPFVPGYRYPSTEAIREANRALFDATPLSALLPTVAIDGGPAVPAIDRASVYLPQLGATRPLADMTVLTVIDIRQARVVRSLAIAGRTDAMYMSTKNLYFASSRYENHPNASSLLRPVQFSLLNTDLHQIAIGDGDARVVGTGSVEGFVGYGSKASFRFGEDAGRLGVVTSANMWGASANRVTLLKPSAVAPGLLKTLSYLPNSRRSQPLGKPGEQLYGTRFVGDKLYAVTFRQIDPLYIVDLADTSDPKITGELQIPGFSDYLHPLPNGLLLGFGREARIADNAADGQWAWFQGLQLSLYDVSGAAPRELQRVVTGKRGSESALFADHHAFSVLARSDGTTMVALPASIHDGTPQYGTGDSAWYKWEYSGLLHFEVRGSSPADARLAQARTLVTARSSGGYVYPPNGEGWWDQGRSILFPDASIYVSRGEFWRQDAAGNTTGPF